MSFVELTMRFALPAPLVLYLSLLQFGIVFDHAKGVVAIYE